MNKSYPELLNFKKAQREEKDTCKMLLLWLMQCENIIQMHFTCAIVLQLLLHRNWLGFGLLYFFQRTIYNIMSVHIQIHSQNHRLTEQYRLEGPLEIFQSNHPARPGPSREYLVYLTWLCIQRAIDHNCTVYFKMFFHYCGLYKQFN